jgi:hypothetical protein
MAPIESEIRQPDRITEKKHKEISLLLTEAAAGCYIFIIVMFCR